jgi:hypothetical protein
VNGSPPGAPGLTQRTPLERLGSAFGAPFLFFLALPLVVYALNAEEVDTSKRVILESGLLATALVAAVLWLLASLPRAGPPVAAACDVVAVTLFVVLLLAPNRAGEVTGFTDALAGLGNRAPLLKLGALVGLGALACFFRPRLFRAAAQSVVATALIGGVVVALFVRSAADGSKQVSADEARRLLALGGDANVIVLVLDSFTGFRMAEIAAAKPEIRAALAGFTLYPRAIASALNTPAGNSVLLTGDLQYALEVEQETERNSKSLDNSFLAEAWSRGIDTAYVSPLRGRRSKIPSSEDGAFLPRERPPFADRLQRYFQFLVVSSARVLPADGVRGLERLTSRIRWPASERRAAGREDSARAKDSLQRGRIADKRAFDRILELLHVGDGETKLLYYFTRLSHGPWSWTEDGRFEPGAGWESSSIFSARAVTQLVARLRALDVWDDALVIVASDHGGVPVADRSMGGLFPPERRLHLGFNPLIMVKPPRATEPLRISEMTVWLGDVAPTVREALKLPQPAGLEFASRSLLGPDDPGRVLALPVFFHPDQGRFHDPLKRWLRVDVRGTFEAFGEDTSLDPSLLLSRSATIVLRSGSDRYATKMARRRFRAKDKYTSAWIEIDGRQIGKVQNVGVVAVSDAGGRFHVQRQKHSTDGLAAMVEKSGARNSFVAAVGVPRQLAARYLGDEARRDGEETVNCVFVASERSSPRALSRCAPGDVEIEIDWP